MNMNRKPKTFRDMTEDEIMQFLKKTKPEQGLANTIARRAKRTEAMDELTRRSTINAGRK